MRNGMYGALGLALAGILMIGGTAAAAGPVDAWPGATITVTVQWPTDLAGLFTPSGTDYTFLEENLPGHGLTTVGFTENVTVLSTTGPVSDRVSTLKVTFPTSGQLPFEAMNNLVLAVNVEGIVGTGQQPVDWFMTPPVGQMPEVPWAVALPLLGLAAVGVTRSWRASRDRRATATGTV